MGYGDIGIGIGEMFNAFGGAPNYNVLSLTKWPALQQYIDKSLGAFGDQYKAGQAGLEQFTKEFQAQTPQARQYAGQELNALSQFYNGGVAGQLAAFRAQRAEAVNRAADLAAQQAMRGINQSQVGQAGSGSSYASRLALGAIEPIRVQAALDAAGQARGDWGFLTGQQLGLTGARTGLQTQVAMRNLVPTQVGQGLMGTNLGLMTNLENLNLGNKFYGVQKQPTLGDRIIAFSQGAGTMMNGVQTGVSTGMSMGGMMGGGGGGGGMGGMMGGGSGGSTATGGTEAYNSFMQGGGGGGMGGMGGGGGGGGGGVSAGGAPMQLYPTNFGSNSYVPYTPTMSYGGGAMGWGYNPSFGGGGFGQPITAGGGIGNYGQ